jgi:hypothetical protein
MSSLTPIMQQYHRIKARHKDEILLFRLGDFYEMFYEDAKLAARVLRWEKVDVAFSVSTPAALRLAQPDSNGAESAWGDPLRQAGPNDLADRSGHRYGLLRLAACDRLPVARIARLHRIAVQHAQVSGRQREPQLLGHM